MRLIGPNRMRRILIIALSCSLLTIPLNSFSGRTNSATALLAVLQTEDAVPRDAVKLKELLLNGESYPADCAYYELLLQAEALAVSEGANMLKIKKRIRHSRAQRCDGLEIELYRSADPRTAEQSFRWNAARPLTWADFLGPVRSGSGDRTAAETNCGIAIETSLVASGER